MATNRTQLGVREILGLKMKSLQSRVIWGGFPMLYNRFPTPIGSVTRPRCVVVLLLAAGFLFAGSSAVRARTHGASQSCAVNVTQLQPQCQIPEKYRKNWLCSEKWVWKRLCEGKTANLNYKPGNQRLNPTDPADDSKWTETRMLGNTFLRTITQEEPFRTAMANRKIHIIGAYFSGGLQLSDLSIDQPLALQRSLFESPIDMSNFATSSFVYFDGSRFNGDLNMYFASIHGQLSMWDVAFTSAFLRNVKLGTGLNMRGSTFTDTLDLDSALIRGDLIMEQDGSKDYFHFVYLRGATIGGKVDMTGSRFKGWLTMDSTSIAGDLLMRNAQFVEPVNLAFLTVDGNLDARGSTFKKLYLTGARVERELRIGALCEVPEGPCAPKMKWEGAGPKLELRNTEVGTLQDTKDAWPKRLELELDGFTYRRLGASGEEPHGRRGTKWFVEWLGKDETYSPQPYRHLAEVLRNAGLEEVASDILYN